MPSSTATPRSRADDAPRGHPPSPTCRARGWAGSNQGPPSRRQRRCRRAGSAQCPARAPGKRARQGTARAATRKQRKNDEKEQRLGLAGAVLKRGGRPFASTTPENGVRVLPERRAGGVGGAGSQVALTDSTMGGSPGVARASMAAARDATVARAPCTMAAASTNESSAVCCSPRRRPTELELASSAAWIVLRDCCDSAPTERRRSRAELVSAGSRFDATWDASRSPAARTRACTRASRT
jgi:hypothetical protein